MRTNYLLPHRFKHVGWVMMALSAGFLVWAYLLPNGFDSMKFLDCKVFSLFPKTIGLALNSTLHATKLPLWEVTTSNIGDEVAMICVIIAALFVGFSKEKEEDEYVAKIRLESLLWATYINYGLLLLAIVFVYEFRFLDVLIGNLFTLLVVFLVRFNFILFKQRRLQREK